MGEVQINSLFNVIEGMIETADERGEVSKFVRFLPRVESVYRR